MADMTHVLQQQKTHIQVRARGGGGAGLLRVEPDWTDCHTVSAPLGLWLVGLR